MWIQHPLACANSIRPPNFFFGLLEAGPLPISPAGTSPKALAPPLYWFPYSLSHKAAAAPPKEPPA